MSRILACILLLATAACTLASSQFIVVVPAYNPPTFTPLTRYFMSPTGSDASNGLTPATAWATPNHSVNCGDVILAQAGTYTITGAIPFGSVSSCPSTSGGIDGHGGIYFAVVLCAGTAVGDCAVSYNGVNQPLFDVTNNNWAVEGFKVTSTNNSGRAFVADGAGAAVNYVAFVNNIAANVGIGYAGLDDGTNHDVPGATGFDHTAVVGNIAENAENDTICTGQFGLAGPATVGGSGDTSTRSFWYGNFSWNTGSNGCSIDEENYIIDTWDAHQYIQQTAFLNNIGWSSWRFGLQVFNQTFNSLSGLHRFIENNTFFHNNLSTGATNGNINIQNDNTAATNETVYNNVSLADQSNTCAMVVGGANGPGSLANIDTGTPGNENVFFGINSASSTCAFNGYTFSSNNFLVNPNFTNTTDLLNNQSGTPNCAGYATTTACMGWNAKGQSLTIPSVISDLTATCTNCSGKGYQRPSTTCLNGGVIYTLYPKWLKGVVYLHTNSGFVSGAIITEEGDLVTKPCGM